MTIIRNAKPILFGTDTHGALLVGTVSIGQSNTSSVIDTAGTGHPARTQRSSSSTTGQTLLTIPGSITTPTNSVMLVTVMMVNVIISDSSSTNKSLTVRRDGTTTILGPFSLTGIRGNVSGVTFRQELLTPIAGSHTYTLVSEDNVSYGAVRMNIRFIQLTDTHAVNMLSGSNTQYTAEETVIKS